MNKFVDDLTTRFGQTVEQLGGATAMSKLLDVSRGTIYNWMGGTEIPMSKLFELEEKTGIDVWWLLTGRENEPANAAKEAPLTAYEAKRFEEYDYIDFLDVEASAGAGAVVEGEEVKGHLAFRKDWLRRQGLRPQHLALLTVRGDSMEPSVPNGSTCLVERYDEAQEPARDGIYVLRWDDHLVVKRLQRQIGGGFVILSDNPAYAPQHVPADRTTDLRIAGRVVWLAHEI
jgi:phage repressor protein C with HTH and peptisase S24 domain